MADSSSAPAGATPPKVDAPEPVAPASEDKPSSGDANDKKLDGGETVVEEVTLPGKTHRFPVSCESPLMICL